MNADFEIGKVDKRPSFPPIRFIIGLAYSSYDPVLDSISHSGCTSRSDYLAAMLFSSSSIASSICEQ